MSTKFTTQSSNKSNNGVQGLVKNYRINREYGPLNQKKPTKKPQPTDNNIENINCFSLDYRAEINDISFSPFFSKNC